MARGESEAKERDGTGLAIWAVFGVACLAAALLVVWATAEPSAPAVDIELGEPFPGAEATLAVLSWRGCARGPALPSVRVGATLPFAEALDADLIARGYAPVTEWSQGEALPDGDVYAQLVGACGVVALAVEPGGFISGSGTDEDALWGPCNTQTTTIGVCGATPVHVKGTGLARVRLYLMPGVTEGAAQSMALPAEVVLAHAEAEVLLAQANWEAHDQLGRHDLAPLSGVHRISAPTPASGCVPWMAAGVGVGAARVTWLGRNVSWNTTSERFLMGIIACSGSGPLGARTSVLQLTDNNHGGTVWFRPYDATGGPATTGAAVTTITEARVGPTGAVRLAPGVRDRFRP